MAKFLTFLMVFIATSSTVAGIFNPFEKGQTGKDNQTTTTVPHETPTTVQPVSDRTNPFVGLSLFEQIKMQMRRRREEQRRKIFILIHGKRPLASFADSKGPQCSSCTGDSLKNCAESATTKQCDSNSECYTIQLTSKDGQTTVQKDCVEKTRCETDVCKTIQSSSGGGEYTNCKMECCKGDMCNKMYVPKPLPTSQGPTGLKCLKCRGNDVQDCDKNLEQVECPSNKICAAIAVRYKDGKGTVERNCVEARTCQIGVCNVVNRDGIFPYCNASCCKDNLCDGFRGSPPTKPPPPKCYYCVSNNQTECDRNLAVLQCKEDERCYSGGLIVTNSNQGGFKRGCTSHTLEECKTYCKRLGNSVRNCSFQCCEGSMCNKPGVPVKPPTTRPPTPALTCIECSSDRSEEDCQSRGVLKQCPIGRLCHSSRALFPAGNKIFAKGCMDVSQCNGGACSRHNIKNVICNVTCCSESRCNRMVAPPTKTPVSNPNVRALLKMIEAFRVLLEAIESSIRASANDFKAADYKDQLRTLMTQLEQHKQTSAVASPLQKIAKSQLVALRMRADEVLKKL